MLVFCRGGGGGHRLCSRLFFLRLLPAEPSQASPCIRALVRLTEWQQVPAAPQALARPAGRLLLQHNVSQPERAGYPPPPVIVPLKPSSRSHEVSFALLQPNDQLSPSISGASIIFWDGGQRSRLDK